MVKSNSNTLLKPIKLIKGVALSIVSARAKIKRKFYVTLYLKTRADRSSKVQKSEKIIWENECMFIK